MPSLRHEIIIDLFRDNPMLLGSLLAYAVSQPLPAFTSVRAIEGGLSDLPPEFRADLVLVFSFGTQPVLAVVLEVQLGPKEDKRRVWPGYLGVARARYSCPASLVVITLESEVQRWAAQPIVDPVPGGLSLRPLALGPGSYPILTAQQSADEPGLAMISVLAHAASPRLVEVAEAALQGFTDLPEDQRKVYYEIIFATFREACRKGLLETQMLAQLMDKYRTQFRGFYEEGLADGERRGRNEGQANSILALLASRGLAASPDQERRIRSCQDPATLLRWLVRAASAANPDDIFTP